MMAVGLNFNILSVLYRILVEKIRKIELNNVFFPISSFRDSLEYININEHICIISAFYTCTDA